MKISRNQKCPCGSGKKFKQCCLANDLDSPSNDSDYPQQMFGYIDKEEFELNKNLLDENGLVCMISNITILNIDDLRRSTGADFQIGNWFLSTGAHEDTIVYGPLESIDIALEAALELTGANRFINNLATESEPPF
jgi:hypothetical protein